MAKRLLRREHIVAASLVGSVVVVIGFASGLGTRPGTGASAAPAPGDAAEPPVATAPPQTTQAQPRQSGGSSGGGHSGGGGGGGAVLPVTTVPTVTPTHGHPTTPTTTTPPTGTTPPTTCDPGLVPAAVGTLLDTLGQAVGALGLPGAIPATAATTTALLPGVGIPAVDQFIATCQTTTAPPTTTTTMPTGHGG